MTARLEDDMTPQQPTVGVILERIDKLRADIADIKDILAQQTNSFATFKIESSNDRAVINEKIAELRMMTTDHEDRIICAEKVIERLRLTDAIVRWVGVVLMGSIITLIWMIIVHQVSIVVP